ncbi:AraC family transcriptional regulator [uncultured Ruminococcus sp.]|uniref:AraC family transcriptional regulator n=1 Tax=uncultured Ruminococcus sp. TaxID=165186 RepID=UPI0025E67FAB|nr:AraC family transcriptional regulator [uncultured Ruminococcus sp.]
MKINNVGYNHRHDTDFIIERPEGSGDCLLLLLKTDGIFTIDNKEIKVAKDSFFLFPQGMPQYYRCVPKHEFANDWIHFHFEDDEEAEFLKREVPYAQGIRTDSIEFLSWCVKAIADEYASKSPYSQENMQHYMWLIFNRVSDALHLPDEQIHDSEHEMLLTIRHKIYAEPYIPRSITWAAHEVRMSPASFQYYYKKTFEVTFVQDFINAKIEYAKMLLTSTNLSAYDIAGKCGYRNYEHFARQFKERCGITPLDYRKQKK